MSIANIITSNKDISYYIGGSGGTGKSHLIKEITKLLPEGSFLVTASTGVAAIPLEGHTLHRALGLGLFKGKVSSLHAQMENKPNLLKKWKTIDTLIIDEISMLNVEVFVKASRLMSLVRDDPRPFGGIRLILSGDFLQLPPVEQYRENGRTYTFVFEHPIWNELNLEYIVLDTPYRYVSRDFYDTLSDLRYGIFSDRVRELIEKCDRKIEKHPTGIIPTIIFAINRDVDDYNNEKLAKLPGDEHTYKAVWSSSFRGEPITTDKKIKENILRDTRLQDTLILKKGAQVMLMLNTIHESLANGSRGVVVGFSDQDYPIVRFLNGLELPIKPNRWPSFGYPRETVDGLEWERHVITQVPLRLCWAVTCHKCQGLTLDTAVLAVDRCFASSHLYVMFSRCRDPQYMYVYGWEDEIFDKCLPDNKAIDFHKKIECE